MAIRPSSLKNDKSSSRNILFLPARSRIVEDKLISSLFLFFRIILIYITPFK